MTQIRRLTALALSIAAVATACHSDWMYPQDFLDTCRDNGPHCQTDNTSVSYFIADDNDVDGFDGFTDLFVVLNMADLIEREWDGGNGNVLNWTYDSTPSYAGGSETDAILLRDSTLPLNNPGTTICEDAADSDECDQHYVIFRDSDPLDGIICHEMGHSIGLLHGEFGDPSLANDDGELFCMQTMVGNEPPQIAGIYNWAQINDTW